MNEMNENKEMDELDNLLLTRQRVDAVLREAHNARTELIDTEHKLSKAFRLGGDELAQALEAYRSAVSRCLVAEQEISFLKINLDSLDAEISAVKRGREFTEKITGPYEKRIAREQQLREIGVVR